MRVHGWQESLDAVMEDARTRQFEWGVHDCCEFIARCAKAVTGEDFRAKFGSYSSEAEAAEILKLHGGMRGLLTHAFGDPVHVSLATVGDIVLIDMGAGEQPAVCVGVYARAPGACGLEYRRMALATDAWVL